MSNLQNVSNQTEIIPASIFKPGENLDGGVLITDGSCANRDVVQLTANFKITAPTKHESGKRDLLMAGQLGKTEGLSPTSPPNDGESPLKRNGEDVALVQGSENRGRMSAETPLSFVLLATSSRRSRIRQNRSEG